MEYHLLRVSTFSTQPKKDRLKKPAKIGRCNKCNKSNAGFLYTLYTPYIYTH